MHEVVVLVGVLLIGVVTGFLDSTVGNGGSISIPFLIFVGLSPQVAIATDRLGSVGQTATATLKFLRSGKIVWEYVPLFTILSIGGTIIGANILLHIDPKMLQKVLGILLLLLLPLTFFKKEIGVKSKKVVGARKVTGSVLYFFLTIFNGFLGVGVGPLSYYNFMFNFGFTFLEANATNIIPWFALSAFSLFVFAHAGIVDFKIGVFLLIGMIIGGYLGASFALKNEKSNLWIRRLFVVIVIIVCMKLLFF